jgi:hypothetical protein
MTDDRAKSKKEKRLEKAKGRLQQSLPEIRQLVRTSEVVGVARKITGPAQSLFRQFAEDIQLKDLLAKVEALVANPDRTFTKAVSKDTPAPQTFRGETSSNEPAKQAGTRKAPAKLARPKKAVPKKTRPKTKKKPAPRRKVKARS